MWLKLTFDERGKVIGSTVDDTGADVPIELPANEIIVDDPAIIEQILKSGAELQNGQLAFAPKAPPPGPDYRMLRRGAYPPVGDQLDALWKMIEPPIGSEAEAMKAAIMAVKAKYPKPL